jgi:hypothetical protein
MKKERFTLAALFVIGLFISNTSLAQQGYTRNGSKGKTKEDVICFLQDKIFINQNSTIEVSYFYSDERESHMLVYRTLKSGAEYTYMIDRIDLHHWNTNGPLAELVLHDIPFPWRVVGPTIETGFFNLHLRGDNSRTQGCTETPPDSREKFDINDYLDMD